MSSEYASAVLVQNKIHSMCLYDCNLQSVIYICASIWLTMGITWHHVTKGMHQHRWCGASHRIQSLAASACCTTLS